MDSKHQQSRPLVQLYLLPMFLGDYPCVPSHHFLLGNRCGILGIHTHCASWLLAPGLVGPCHVDLEADVHNICIALILLGAMHLRRRTDVRRCIQELTPGITSRLGYRRLELILVFCNVHGVHGWGYQAVAR